MNIHKNARLTPQGRLLLVERITEAGWSVQAREPAPEIECWYRLREAARDPKRLFRVAGSNAGRAFLLFSARRADHSWMYRVAPKTKPP
jgi:hypothetical protein